jgi:anti-anti-sigma regulatory factor
MPTADRVTLHVDARELAASAAAVDLLARLALMARRHGCELSLRGVSAELRELIDLAGLSQVLHDEAAAPRSQPPITPRSTLPRC